MKLAMHFTLWKMRRFEGIEIDIVQAKEQSGHREHRTHGHIR